MNSASTRISGFTLIEMVVTTTIVAILLAIGVPSYRYVTTANRATGEINGLLGDLQFARAEAIKQGLTISVCPTSNYTSCAGSTEWKNGWLVFTDADPVGSIEGTDAVLHVQRSFANSDSLAADNAVQVISFNREGFAMNLPGPVTVTLHDSSLQAQYTRCLSLTIVGALSTQIGGANTAEDKPCS